MEQAYPSGRKVRNVLDGNGDLLQVESKKNANSGYWQYAGSFSYAPSGAVTSMQLGNGRWESTQFNSRLQPTQIALGATQNSTNLLKLNYNYGTTANNGNVLSQQITVPAVGSTPGFTANQSYQYDALNRLAEASEIVAGSQTWRQTFVFDRYGNRRFDTAANRTTTLAANCPAAVCNPAASAANNRLVGTTYDGAGNTTLSADSQQYVYDGENKMVAAKDASGNVLGQYWYDGDGKRVKKYVPGTGETTIFVYDAAGKTVAEYSTQLSQSPQIAYLTSDTLGTPRINTGANGSVFARHDYQPYGEEIAGAGGRTQALGYAGDEVRKQFTGYERDDESGLDFAQARMYSSQQGRFRSPDPYNILFQKNKGKNVKEDQQLLNSYILNPQVWNKYAYVLNSPYDKTDASGNCSAPTGLKQGQTGICIEAFIASRTVGGLGFGDNRGFNGNNANLTARVQVHVVVTPHSSNGETPNSHPDKGNYIAWHTETASSGAFVPILNVPVFLQGTSTTTVTNATTEADGATNFTLSVTATNGFSANNIPGAPAGDIAFDLNLVVTGDGRVGLRAGSEARTFPSFAVYGYTNNDGTVNTTEIITVPEQQIADLTKPKQPLPVVAPR